MGYRTYIGLIDKKEYDKISNFSIEQLKKYKAKKHKEKYNKDKTSVMSYDLVKEIHGMGKYCNFDFCKKDFFLNEKTNKYITSDGEFFIIGPEGLESVINEYKKDIHEYYQKLRKQDEKDIMLRRVQSVESFLDEKIDLWSGKYNELLPIDMNKEKEEISQSWNKEYIIFELVRLYKTIDFNKHILVYYGY